jgi:phosphatidylserine decarboxylase
MQIWYKCELWYASLFLDDWVTEFRFLDRPLRDLDEDEGLVHYTYIYHNKGSHYCFYYYISLSENNIINPLYTTHRLRYQLIMPATKHEGLVQNLIHVIEGRVDQQDGSAVSWKANFEKAIQTAITKADSSTKRIMNNEKNSDLESFYLWLDEFLKWTPKVDTENDEVLQKICIFYWVFDQPSVRQYQTKLDPKKTKAPQNFLSYWLISYAQQLGKFMDTEESKKGIASFYNNKKYNPIDPDTNKKRSEQWEKSQNDWTTFNDFFSRKLKTGSRPIDKPTDNKIIVSPADSTFDSHTSIKNGAVEFFNPSLVEAKGITWTISSLLEDSDYKNEFKDGSFMHSFLGPTDYHRQHAPIAGKVVEVKNIQGQVYLEVTGGKGGITPVRPLPLHPAKPGQGPPGDIIAQDRAGYQWCQTRGLLVIDTTGHGNHGFVAVLPIGMAQVSSVVMTAKKGSTLKKGDEISYFQFGGSDIVVVFANPPTYTANENTHYKVGKTIANW